MALPGVAGKVAGSAMLAPEVKFAFSQSFLKEEDVILVKPKLSWPSRKGKPEVPIDLQRVTALNGAADLASQGLRSDDSASATGPMSTYGLFCVFDGHNGVAAAQYAADKLQEYLEPLLPCGGGAAAESDVRAHTLWRESLQRALTIALTLLHRSFAGQGILAGCTATVVLQCGWLLTVANLGDSRAIVDTGRQVMQATADHRVASHQAERRRLEAHGAIIAPVDISGWGPATGTGAVGLGPLRLWPGGLALSRSLGDFDVGSSVITLPHVMQVRVPHTGARLMVASDGVWDAFDKMSRVGSIARSWSTEAAPSRVVSAIVRAHGGLRDDTSIIVLDILPPGSPGFASLGKGRSHTASGGGGGFCCFGGSPVVEAAPRQELEVLAQLDVAELAGMIPEATPPRVPWFTPQLQQALLEAMEQSIEIYRRAADLRRLGRQPSISDFAKLLLPPVEAASAQAALNKSQEDMHAFELPATRTVKSPRTSVEVQQRRALTQDASVRFGNAVAYSEHEYAQKFGHFAKQQRISPSAPQPAGKVTRASMELASATRLSIDRGGGPRATSPLRAAARRVKSGGQQQAHGVDHSVRVGQRGQATPSAGGMQLPEFSVYAGKQLQPEHKDVEETDDGGGEDTVVRGGTAALKQTTEDSAHRGQSAVNAVVLSDGDLSRDGGAPHRPVAAAKATTQSVDAKGSPSEVHGLAAEVVHENAAPQTARK